MANLSETVSVHLVLLKGLRISRFRTHLSPIIEATTRQLALPSRLACFSLHAPKGNESKSGRVQSEGLCLGSSLCVDLCMGTFFLRREMVPEESDAKGAVRSFHCFLDLFLVVNVALHNFRAQVRQSQGCLGERVSGDGTNRKGPARILPQVAAPTRYNPWLAGIRKSRSCQNFQVRGAG